MTDATKETLFSIIERWGFPTLVALAAETARMVVQMRHEPAPTPAPPKPVVPAGKCPKCLGTGRMSTDGRIVITCPACKGTGKACSDGRCQ